MPLTVTGGQGYYIRVVPYSSSSGTYRIGVNTVPLPCGTLAAATALSAGSWTDGVLTSASGEQWFKFTATAGTHYLHVSFGTLTDLYVQLYDSTGGTLGNRTNLYSSARYTPLTVTGGQTYYIRVTSASSNGGTYRIGFNDMPLAPGTLSEAATLTQGAWADGVLTPASGAQWFTFTATAGTHYLHVIFGTLTNLYVQLYDSNGGTLGNSMHLYIYSWESVTSKSLVVTSGQTYYIRVTPYSSTGGTYRIAFNASETAPAE
jgi:hypothetical protein